MRPWESAVPEPPAKAFSRPDGAAGGGGGKLVVRYVDGPGALADGNTGQRRLIARIEPALGESQPAERPATAPPRTSRPAARRIATGRRRDEILRYWVTKGAVLAHARDTVSHLGKNPRQTTICGASASNRKPQVRRRKGRDTPDFGGEYAVYMMARNRIRPGERPAKPAFGRRSAGWQNLDAPAPAPIRPRFPRRT